MVKPVVLLVMFSLLGCGQWVYAHDSEAMSCNTEINRKISIAPGIIRVTRDDQSQLVINKNDELFIDERKIQLTPEQQQLVEDYADQMRETIPMVVDVVLEAVEMALNALTEVYYSFFETDPPEDLMIAINDISKSVKEKLRHDGNEIYLDAGEIKGLDETMAALEPKLEQALSSSIGDMIIAAGNFIKEEDGDLMTNIAEFVRRVENMGTELENRIGDRAHELERKADQLCESMASLDEIESELAKQLPQFKDYDLVKLKNNSI